MDLMKDLQTFYYTGTISHIQWGGLPDNERAQKLKSFKRNLKHSLFDNRKHACGFLDFL